MLKRMEARFLDNSTDIAILHALRDELNEALHWLDDGHAPAT
jgi:hypothetical protein